MVRPKILLMLAGYVLGTGALLCVYYGALTVPSPPMETVKFDLQGKVESLQQRVGYAELMVQKKWHDVMQTESRLAGNANLSLPLPSIFDFLPYLRNSTHLEPALRVSNSSRSGVRVVLGIPSVKRDIQSYLTSTVENLIANMNPKERDMTLIVILLADTNTSKVDAQLQDVRAVLDEHLRSGLVEVINPPKQFYPDMNALGTTLGDDIQRVKWRTKQAYDFAYLMMYASSRGEFYVQLEDDILSKPGFVTQMLKFAQRQMASNLKNFFVLDFCQLGFIGKLFKCVDLMKFATYILTFASDQPVDWILDHYVQTKVCRFDKDAKHCRKMKGTIWIAHKPSLFQHVGTHSSLKGKTQKLKDRQFGKVNLFIAHRDNVPAEVTTSIKSYKTFTIERAYLGDSLFWGLLPAAGDHITIAFHEPVILEKVLFRSGDAEHPNDRFVNASIEVLPYAQQQQQDSRQQLDEVHRTIETNSVDKPPRNDSWQEITRFDHSGVAQSGPIPYPVMGVRLVVLVDQDHWGVLSELQVKGSVHQVNKALL
ncbi:alpha-1,3-mannosyl-glycoprotein 4-beta-N-acetylglucosaminyltransferase B [Galendromus occidentalis]|uniref:Alpha-1,3-mannosyl-glycoprotein 4-beta-N-acetylglucosaminyltransferase B n=1 Tax=Galendromus occidentalis TaxID=34638 RepID=A0AAJ6QN77_9ACAR|nr:alpha-1,3-mannosyl-glycoprotein 4-beta-N-acetylglucosaminyltransferase B [Galendromus occidentalis]